MKIFLDTADVDTIKNLNEIGLIDGVTTNPTLIRKSGANPDDIYSAIADLGVLTFQWKCTAMPSRCMTKHATVRHLWQSRNHQASNDKRRLAGLP